MFLVLLIALKACPEKTHPLRSFQHRLTSGIRGIRAYPMELLSFPVCRSKVRMRSSARGSLELTCICRTIAASAKAVKAVSSLWSHSAYACGHADFGRSAPPQQHHTHGNHSPVTHARPSSVRLFLSYSPFRTIGSDRSDDISTGDIAFGK